MRVLAKIKSWARARRPKKLDQLLSIRFDEATVNVVVLDELDPGWNQSFQWANVKRVCFKDEGLYASDSIWIYLEDRDEPVVILVEAEGGTEFFGALTARGCFPEQVWRRAVADTSGGLHCWPPLDNDSRPET